MLQFELYDIVTSRVTGRQGVISQINDHDYLIAIDGGVGSLNDADLLVCLYDEPSVK